MRLVTLGVGGESHAGAVIGQDIVDLVHPGVLSQVAGRYSSVADLLRAGEARMNGVRRLVDEIANGPETVRKGMRDTSALISMASARLLAPLPRPKLILSCGRAYRQHTQEMQGAGARLPEHPHAFIKNANAVIGPGAPIRLPSQCPDKVDYEGEFSIVIGRPCHNVSAKEAKSFIAGYTLINDVSARDWNPPKGDTPDWEMIHMGKQLPTFCPLGPAVVTADEIPDPDNVRLVTRLNGQVMQDANTNDLIFPIAEIVAYFSRWYPFEPGDVITTGSPSGVGFARQPPVFMKAGDVVVVSVDRIGELSNPVVAPS